MFDCVMPTRNGRNAYAFTAAGPLRLRNSKLRMDTGPMEEGCDCYACRHFTRGAIRVVGSDGPVDRGIVLPSQGPQTSTID